MRHYTTQKALVLEWLFDDGYLTGKPEIDEPTMHRGQAKRECAEQLRTAIDELESELHAPDTAVKALVAKLYATLRSIRYHAEHGHQDRPLHERLRLIGEEANKALEAALAASKAEAAEMVPVFDGYSLPRWLLESAVRIERYMAAHHTGEWVIGGIQSRAALSAPAVAVEAVATLHSDGYWTHEPGCDPFDRFGPNANARNMPVYAIPQPAAGAVPEALQFLLPRIGSWTDSRWDQHLRYEFGDERAAPMIAALNAMLAAAPSPEQEE